MDGIKANVAMTALEALEGRRSVRAFKGDPVPRATVETILRASARAPSGTNMQPWKVYVLSGSVKDRLSDALLAAHAAGSLGEAEYRYYPENWREPYLSRRRKVGFDLYALLGIAKGDKEAMWRQAGRNYTFFGAPVGLIFTIDRDLEIGSWLDHGMFLQSIMIAARHFGLETCPQAAFAKYSQIIRQQLSIPTGEAVVCGMALGYEDKDAPQNKLTTERADLTEFANFHWGE